MATKVQYRSTNCLELCSAHCVEVCKSLWSLQQSSQLCDMFLTAGDEVIFAHRNVLAAFSPIFHSKDSGVENTESVLEIHVVDTPSVVVKEVIRYLYTGFIRLNKDNVNQVESFCKRWKIESAFKLCDKFKKESEKLDQNNGTVSDNNDKCEKGHRAGNAASRNKPRKRSWHSQECEEGPVEICEKNPRIEFAATPHGAVDVDKIFNGIVIESSEKSICDQASQNSSDDLPTPQMNNSKSNTASMCSGYRQVKNKTTPRKNLRTVQSSSDSSKLQDCDPKLDVKVVDRTDCLKEGAAQPDAPNTPLARLQQTTQKPTKKNIICPLCQKVLPSVKALSKHKHKCKACPKCRQLFKTRKKCVSHIAEKSCTQWGTEKFKCPECEKSYMREANLDTHVMKCHPHGEFTEPGVRACKVEGCNFQTQLKRNLQKHIKYMHTESKDIMCDICGAMSKNVYYLRVHQRKRHSDALSCDICGLRVKNRAILKSHKMRQHGQGTREYLCTQCTYITYTKTELDKHMFHKHKVPLPSGNEGHRCPHCRWKCLQKSSMDQHILRHTAKERNFPCTICNKRFITGGDLKGHMVCHDPDSKKFKCPHCDYCTAYGKYKLREHVSRIHENKDYKPWECNLCSYCTNVKGNLTSHLRKMHKLNVDTQQHLINKAEPINAAKSKMEKNAGVNGLTGTTNRAPGLTGTVSEAPGTAGTVDTAPGMTGTTGRTHSMTNTTDGAPSTNATTGGSPGMTVSNRWTPATVGTAHGALRSTGTVGMAPNTICIMDRAPGTVGANGGTSSTAGNMDDADWQEKKPSELCFSVQPVIVAPLTPLPHTTTPDSHPAGQVIIQASSSLINPSVFQQGHLVYLMVL